MTVASIIGTMPAFGLRWRRSQNGAQYSKRTNSKKSKRKKKNRVGGFAGLVQKVSELKKERNRWLEGDKP